ncbi:MAG: DUF4831 family protein [Alistipes sp.]|nr:DUF4831 family protein [Alistipes sp.]
MKRFLISMAVLTAVASASAQNRPIVRTGVFDRNGETVFSEPASTITVDLTVERNEIITGPYARYAQKYLGVRAPLSDKTTWSITGASISLAGDGVAAAAVPAQSESRTELHFGTAREFARLSPDRTDARALTADEAAAEAADAIFSLRKHRMDLITGEAGENVFGGGLEAALKTIDAYETAYLELFFGKRAVTAETVRLTVHPSGDKFGYVLCRFSEKEGIVPSTDLSGEMVMLRIEPSGDTSLKYIREATEKDKSAVECRVADLSTCILSCGTEELASAVLPLFEYGRTLRVAKQ